MTHGQNYYLVMSMLGSDLNQGRPGLPTPGLTGRNSVDAPALRQKLANDAGSFDALFCLGLSGDHWISPFIVSARDHSLADIQRIRRSAF